MATILDIPSIGGRLGASFGTGLQALAQHKINELMARGVQQKSQQRFEQGGFPKDIAGFLSGYTPDQQVDLIKALSQSGALASLQEQQSAQSEGNTSGSEGKLGPQGSNKSSGAFGAFTQLPLREQRDRREESRKIQQYIDKKNSPIVKDLRDNRPVAQSIKDDVAEARKLLENPDIQSGYFASKYPKELWSAPTQRLAQIYERLALSEVAKSGRATDYKTRMIRATKPEIGQDIRVQKRALEKLDQSSDDILNRYSAYENLVNSNNGNEPANLELKIRDYLSGNEQPSQGNRSEKEQSLLQPPLQPEHELIAGSRSAPQQQNEGILGSLGRNAVSGIVKGAQGAAGLLGIPGSIESLLPKSGGQILPTMNDIQQRVKGAAEKVLPEGYLEPRNKLESGIQTFAENVGAFAPHILSGGTTAILPAAEKAAVSAFGSTLAKDAIGGPWAELIGSLVASAGYDFWKKGGNAFYTVARARSEKGKTEAYNIAQKAIVDNKITVPAQPIRNETNNIFKKFETVLTPAETSDLRKTFIKVENAVRGKEVGAQEIWDLKKMLNRSISQIDDPTLKVPYIQLSQLLKDTLTGIGKKFPDFGESFAKGESYTAGLRFMSSMTKALEGVTGSKYYLSKVILNGLGALGGGSWAPLGKLGTVLGGKKLSETLDFARSPAGKRELAKAFTEAMFGDKHGLLRALRDLEKGKVKREEESSGPLI